MEIVGFEQDAAPAVVPLGIVQQPAVVAIGQPVPVEVDPAPPAPTPVAVDRQLPIVVTDDDAALGIERTARIAGDASLQAEIDALAGDTETDIQAARDAVDAAEAQAATALASAKTDLQVSINSAKTDLQTAIAAVQASSDGVAALLASESTARHDADSAEVTARTTAIAGVQSGINTLAAALTTEQTTRADADSAETTARQAAVAGVQSGLDTVTAGLATEITARANADSAETSARQTQVAQVQNAVDTVAAGLTSEATTRASADAAETSARQTAISSLQGQVNDVNAALTSESSTRATNDSAETNARTAAVSNLQGQINTTNAALTSEATTRSTADAAETNARQAAVASLQDGLNAANAAIITEQNARVSADSSEASARTTLSSSLSAQINPKRIFTSATAPTFDQLFPPNVQACPVANLKPADGLTGIGFWTNTTRSIANHGIWTNGEWNITGEAVLIANLAGTWASDGTYEVVDIYDFGQCHNIVPGSRYEWSAYTGSHRARTRAGIVWYTAASAYISEQWSDGSGSPLYAFGGANVAEKLGGNSIDNFKRLGLIATAPANAAIAVLRTRMDNIGFGGQGDPYTFACRPYFGLARNDQTTLTDWQPYQPALWMNPSEGNKPYIWSGIYGAGFVAVDDTRLSAHSTSISQLMSATDGLKAMWGVQIDVNGKVTGRVKLDGSGGTSEFSVLATSFTVSMPGYNSPIFEVGNVNGSPKVTIRADVIQDSSVSDGKIGSLNLNAAAAASANSGAASITVALKAGVPVLVIGKSAAPSPNAIAGGSVITTTLKVGSTTIDTDTAASIADAGGTTHTPQTSLMALYTPPSDGNYTFAVENIVTTQKTVAVMRTYKG